MELTRRQSEIIWAALSRYYTDLEKRGYQDEMKVADTVVSAPRKGELELLMSDVLNAQLT